DSLAAIHTGGCVAGGADRSRFRARHTGVHELRGGPAAGSTDLAIEWPPTAGCTGYPADSLGRDGDAASGRLGRARSGVTSPGCVHVPYAAEALLFAGATVDAALLWLPRRVLEF